jgi:tetratricopeptide (TPR) repeat protein
MRHGIAILLCLLFAPLARAGLHCPEETFAELPTQWRGFLLDQRLLRTAALVPMGNVPPGAVRARYLQAAERLAALDNRSADQSADLGGLYLRLGQVNKALAVLRPAQRDNPNHYRLASNLGTAWQMSGELAQAAAVLETAVRLAPEKYAKAEALQLRLVRLRLREMSGQTGLGDLFGIRFVGPSGKYEPGRLDVAEVKKLPADAVAGVQQLALWLPADARLLWQLAELAAAGGDVPTAAAMLDGCVTEFGLRHPDLREHRQAVRAAADALAARPDERPEHTENNLTFKARSSRPLQERLDAGPLPPIDPKGTNRLPWALINETVLDRQYRPTFPRYLQDLDGKQVTLTGHMQPLGDDQECAAFLLVEYPIGCWYCEMPSPSDIILVELEKDKVQNFTRGPVKITGRLALNRTDPERFLYVLRDARSVADKEGQ